jgi:PAS domain S-box-containing protein
MAYIPALIPLGMSLARISRNSSDDDNHIVVPHKDRGRAIINKMIKGGANAPICEWSEAKLEKAISRNSMFRDHADELRLARVNGLLAAVQENHGVSAAAALSPAELTKSAITSGGDVLTAVDGENSIASAESSLGQADLLLLAADDLEGRPSNPSRDAALELLADNSFDSILITDPEGSIVYSNKAFTKLTGYEQGDIIGKSPKLLQGPGTDKKVLTRLRDSMLNGDGDYEGSAINYKKDGTPFIMHWRVVPVKIGGEVKAWVAIQREGVSVE